MGHLFLWIKPIANQQDFCKPLLPTCLDGDPTCSWANPVPTLLPIVAPLLLSRLRSFQPGIDRYCHLPPIVPLFYSLTWGGLNMTVLRSVLESGRKLKTPSPFVLHVVRFFQSSDGVHRVIGKLPLFLLKQPVLPSSWFPNSTQNGNQTSTDTERDWAGTQNLSPLWWPSVFLMNIMWLFGVTFIPHAWQLQFFCHAQIPILRLKEYNYYNTESQGSKMQL